MIDQELYDDLRQEDLEESRQEAKHQRLMRTDPEYVNNTAEFQDLIQYLATFTQFCNQYDLDSKELVLLAMDASN